MRYALLTVALMGCATEPVEEPATQVAVETQALENMEEILALQDRVTELEAQALQVESMTTEHDCSDDEYNHAVVTVEPTALINAEGCDDELCVNVSYVRTDNVVSIACQSKDYIRLLQVVPTL